MKTVGACYLVYLAWRIANTAPASGTTGRAIAPLGYWGAVLFQWLNPKTWLMAIGAVTAYAPERHHFGDHYFGDIVPIALVFTLINAPCVSAWAAFGSLLKRKLGHADRLRLFNRLMAAALVLSFYPVLIR